MGHLTDLTPEEARAEVEAWPRSIVQRFWDRVAISDGCWLWKGSVVAGGYGNMRVVVRGVERRILAHRVSWVLHFGSIPEGLGVLHHCDTRDCVNPAHLFVGTHTDNMRDAAAKGRICTIGKSRQTHCRNGHPYDESNTRVDGYGYRDCLECARAKWRKRRATVLRRRALGEKIR